jgi:tight adherence protein B
MTTFNAASQFWVVPVLVLIATLLALQAGFMIWRSYRGPAARKIEKRLMLLSAASDDSLQAKLLKERMLSAMPLLDQWLLKMPRAHGLDQLILQAGLSWTVSRLLLSSAVLAGGSFVLFEIVLRQPWMFSVVAAVVAGAAPFLCVSYLKSRRLKKVESQLPDALDLVVRALRSGHSFASALQMIGDEMPQPIADEFRAVHDEVSFGVSLQQALTNLSSRVPLNDLRYFVVSVMIQRDSGGNLTEVLSNLSRLIRERLKLAAKVRVMSTDGRLSALFLGVMPFLLAALMAWANPEFMSPLWTDPIGQTIIKYLLGMMFVGMLVMRKIIKIRY